MTDSEAILFYKVSNDDLASPETFYQKLLDTIENLAYTNRHLDNQTKTKDRKMNDEENQTPEILDAPETPKRAPRKDRETVLAEAEAKVAKLKAKLDGTFTEEFNEDTQKKLVKRSLRKAETALKDAQALINGTEETDKKKAIKSIDDKIKATKKRLEVQEASKNEALRQITHLPKVIEQLEETQAAIESGADVNVDTELVNNWKLPEEDCVFFES